MGMPEDKVPANWYTSERPPPGIGMRNCAPIAPGGRLVHNTTTSHGAPPSSGFLQELALAEKKASTVCLLSHAKYLYIPRQHAQHASPRPTNNEQAPAARGRP